MADETLEDLVRRLTGLVVKLDERDDHMLALLEEQREFNRQQLQINDRLEGTCARLDTTMQAIKDMLPRRNGP